MNKALGQKCRASPIHEQSCGQKEHASSHTRTLRKYSPNALAMPSGVVGVSDAECDAVVSCAGTKPSLPEECVLLNVLHETAQIEKGVKSSGSLPRGSVVRFHQSLVLQGTTICNKET